MSDLISRSELLKAFNNKNVQITFDLPVEEVLGEDVDLYNFAMLVQDAIQAYKKMVIDTIKNQPTAYDIGNVVNGLESFVKLAEDRLVNGTSKYAYQERKCWIKAIEIVKQGGVSDDVCEWTSTQINSEWKPSCEPNSTYNVFGVAWFRKCPYCGKKIKVVE